MRNPSTSKNLIIVLNFNGKEDTVHCIESLKGQSLDAHILVIDNSSIDGSIDYIMQYHPDIEISKQEINHGFAGGVNIGIKYAIKNEFDNVILFNNDAVADKYWLEELVKQLSDEHPIVTGLLLNKDGSKVDSTSEQYSIWGMAFPRSRGSDRNNINDESGIVFGATGGATAYKTWLFKEIDLFDETFFAYYEDTDISFRAQLAGYKIFYTKDAIAYHKQGASSSKIPGFTVYQTFKNLPLLFWKNVPTKLLIKVGARFTLLYTLIFANAVKKGSGWPALKGVFASIWYFWTNALWKRLKIQRTKKVSADYIWSILYHDLPPEQTGMHKFRSIFIRKK